MWNLIKIVRGGTVLRVFLTILLSTINRDGLQPLNLYWHEESSRTLCKRQKIKFLLIYFSSTITFSENKYLHLYVWINMKCKLISFENMTEYATQLLPYIKSLVQIYFKHCVWFCIHLLLGDIDFLWNRISWIFISEE